MDASRMVVLAWNFAGWFGIRCEGKGRIAVTYFYEGLTVVVFVLICLLFVKPPLWGKRILQSFVRWFDRWV